MDFGALVPRNGGVDAEWDATYGASVTRSGGTLGATGSGHTRCTSYPPIGGEPRPPQNVGGFPPIFVSVARVRVI